MTHQISPNVIPATEKKSGLGGWLSGLFNLMPLVADAFMPGTGAAVKPITDAAKSVVAGGNTQNAPTTVDTSAHETGHSQQPATSPTTQPAAVTTTPNPTPVPSGTGGGQQPAANGNVQPPAGQAPVDPNKMAAAANPNTKSALAQTLTPHQSMIMDTLFAHAPDLTNYIKSNPGQGDVMKNLFDMIEQHDPNSTPSIPDIGTA